MTAVLRGRRQPAYARSRSKRFATATFRDGVLSWNPGMPPASSENLIACQSHGAMRILRGIAISPGIAAGPVVVLGPHGLRLPPRSIPDHAVEAEFDRLNRGLESASAAAARDEEEVRNRLGPQYADILAAHCRMITDPTLLRDARHLIERDWISAEHALMEVLEGHALKLERLTNSHLAARAADVRDIASRILGHLIDQALQSIPDELSAPTIVLAHDISPSAAARLDPRHVIGFATEAGGRSSHTAIVAAALEIPAVAGLGAYLELARQSHTAIVDGDEGLLILDPDSETKERYRETAAERSARFRVLEQQADLPAITLDGTVMELWGNIEFTGELDACLSRGAIGVGLFRTEFLFLNDETAPSEERQFEAYAAVVRSLDGRPLTIRTLDLSADKLPGYREAGHIEPNPALGLRSLRLSLCDPELFRPQLRAALRASLLGKIRILFPLVSTLDELRQARRSLNEVVAELRAQGYPVGDTPPVGVMIEVPAAALTADHLAKEVDFFSIGTNDLIQYTLAVDRTNETVADLYYPCDPAVLRLIVMVVEAARGRGIEVSVCGTMGGDPLYTMLLMGLGLKQLSMPPHQLPEIRRVIRGVRYDDSRILADQALRCETGSEVIDLLRVALLRAFPERAIDISHPRVSQSAPL